MIADMPTSHFCRPPVGLAKVSAPCVVRVGAATAPGTAPPPRGDRLYCHIDDHLPPTGACAAAAPTRASSQENGNSGVPELPPVSRLTRSESEAIALMAATHGR